MKGGDEGCGGAQSDLTAKRYTGQYHEAGLAGAEGLYYYNARWYDPALGRFLQADTLVPEPGNPQALNRYAYVYGNPMRYFDPSGRIRSDQRERERAKCIVLHLRQAGVVVNEDWGWGWMQNANMEYEEVWVEGNWKIDELEAVLVAVDDASKALGGMEAFRERMGTVHVTRAGRSSDDNLLPWRRNEYADTVGSYVTLFDQCFDHAYIDSDEPNPKAIIVHELGHAWDNRRGEWGSELVDEYVGDDEPRPTKNAEKNRWEHWADTVETAVYPGLPSEQAWGPRHEAFWGLAVSGWQGPAMTLSGMD